MTSPNHSPGPWRVYGPGFEVPGYHVHDRIVSDAYNGRLSSDGPADADLQLMAAAPGLFAALRALCAACAYLDRIAEIGSAQDMTNARGRQDITNARGRYDDAMKAAAMALHEATGRVET